MKKLEIQKSIVDKHSANDFPMVKKYSTNSNGFGGYDPCFFSANYEIVGIVPYDCPKENIYLPHFEFNVGSHYSIEVSRSLMPEKTVINHTGRGLELKLKGDNELVEIVFPHLEGLFQLRNLESEGNLMDIVKIKQGKRLPIDASKVRTGFTFRASSTSFGQLYGFMDINHPEAEEIIKEYLETVDRRFADYKELKQYFREKDDKGNILWEDQGLQSREYNTRRKKLHKAMFSDLKKVLKKGNLKIAD